MVNEDDKKTVKKPIPLPRKSLHKQNKVTPAVEDAKDDSACAQKKAEGRGGFMREDWKSASGSFVFEKSRQVKNEVQKLEKSVKSMITRRKSLSTKTSQNPVMRESDRCESLPDASVFLNISFNSPLTDSETQSDCQSLACSEDINFYENDLSPPPYPPPDLPDESVYDKMRNFSLSDQMSYKSTSSESTYDELTSQAPKTDFMKGEILKRSAAQDEDRDSRYEIIDDSVASSECDSFKYLPDIPESEILNISSTSSENKCKDSMSSNIKYIIHLFDPLQEKETNVQDGLEPETKPEFPMNLNSDLPDKVYEKLSIEDFKTYGYPSSSDLGLKEGLYGKIQRVKSSENNYVSLESGSHLKHSLEPPPIPPRSFDSEGSGFEKKTNQVSKEHQKYENVPFEVKPKACDILQWSSLRKVAKIVADNIESRASYISLPGKKSGKITTEETTNSQTATEEKCISDFLPQNFPKHSGVLLRAGGIQRWGVLSQRKLTLFTNKDSPDVKETIPMDGVLSVQVTHNKVGLENVGVHCFEVSLSLRSQSLLFGVPSVSERHIWMRKLLESIGPSFPTKLSMDYTKAGWCYAKEGISCSWSKYCILLHHRTLHLSSDLASHITADLRKARSITLQTEGFPCEQVTEKGPLMLVDLQDKTLYLQMDYERETKAWEVAITDAALKNGPTLCEQQLTKDDVPAIVDKCLNFVHTHGSFSEGIYRRSGSNRTVSRLLASFRCNAWSVQLSKEDCSEFDVSSVLKRYFRDLPEPLLVTEIHQDLGCCLETTDLNKKIEEYKTALKKLPTINYLTARRLLGHLYFINKQKDKNLMGADNLAAIWGPTILQVQDQVSLNSNCFKIEALVLNDLIAYYPEIFDVTRSEVEREMKILQMLESYHNNSNTLNKKPSGELKIWIYLHSPKNVDNCVNVSINPQKTAEEVCKELSYKTNEPVNLLCLEEVVCNGHMTRPLNHSEKVLDTVLRWSYWDEADRKDNCLVLTKNDLFREVVQTVKYPIMVCEELKFADQKSRSFRTCHFEFSQAKLLCYKDKLCTQKIGEWKIEDVVWYLGHEPKRNPHARWSITFIEKQLIGPRSKERPYFGNTISGSSEEQKLKLISSMLVAQYAKDILPTVNLME